MVQAGISHPCEPNTDIISGPRTAGPARNSLIESDSNVHILPAMGIAEGNACLMYKAAA